MTDIARNLSQTGRIKSALERIQGLEDELPKLIAGTNGALAQLEQRISQSTEILNAIAQVVDGLAGDGTVSAKVTDNQIKRAQTLADQQKAGIAAALAEGKLAVTDVIGEKSVVVCVETDKDGNTVPPGYMQMEAARIIPAFHDKFIGQKVGGTVDTPNGGKLTITELYDFVAQPPVAANADTPTTDAPAATPATDVAVDAAPAADAPAAPAADATTTPTPVQA